jgi:hypothetical protein
MHLDYTLYLVTDRSWLKGRDFFGMWRSLASALALGARGRGFKSLHPDQAPWSSGLRHRPFTAVTRVRIPVGSP